MYQARVHSQAAQFLLILLLIFLLVGLNDSFCIASGIPGEEIGFDLDNPQHNYGVGNWPGQDQKRKEKDIIRQLGRPSSLSKHP